MNPKVRLWLAAGLAAAVCAASLGGLFWRRTRALQPAAMYRRLPTRDALVFFIDFEALRRGGLMRLFDSAKPPEDPEYLRFVSSTAFDYKRDLDSVMAAFGPSGRFILAKGRFDWKSLRSYAESQQGKCDGSLCRLVGSAPERRISFLPIQSGLMALAVSTDDMAAMRLTSPAGEPGLQIPDAPVWASLPPSWLKSAPNLPDGTRPFARAVEQAESVVLTFAPEGNRFALKLTVVCGGGQDAYDAASQLTRMTGLLRKLIALEKATPNPGDLSGVLVAGTFRSSGNRVFGYWPIERVLVENLLR
ncbi:MAG TPA: hypothetical protein VKF41_11885 [Bryobacteraceae bacterium]|nr:hypothetical protein [Bryobacteraceae bacterium]